jgi:hypothetical protein
VSWRLEPSGRFSTRSLYRALRNGPKLPLTKLIWQPRIPLKIKIFTWLSCRGRLPSNNLIRSRGASDGNCALCGLPESVDHILFQCILAKFMWSGVRSMFGVNWNPRSLQEWFVILLTLNAQARRMIWTFFAAQSWALWTTRNKFTLENKFPQQLANYVFKCLINLQL